MEHLWSGPSRLAAVLPLAAAVGTAAQAVAQPAAAATPAEFVGRYISGAGDASYLRLLDTAARLFHPDPEFQDIGMLYSPAWNGFVEGPTWGAWWIQNSYGPTYCALPLLTEPHTTFLQNAQDLWFSQMGDGQRASRHGWVAPDGCLCDAAAPNWVICKQGDGRLELHDWALEFTAAGIVMQAELLLISRDRVAGERYVPLLERAANFIESRRDPATNLFLAGAAGNLLAPSHAGWAKPDGTYGRSYLTGLSINYIAALDRLIELERLLGRDAKAAQYDQCRALARQGLPRLVTEEGYFIKSLDPDGTRHGVYGAARHGYLEAVCNHDAIAFRVADDAQAAAIYRKIASIPGLRPHGVIITNCPALDDMYTEAKGLWGFGTWVNGGHWTTCEARMILSYFRLEQYEDARRAMEHILGFYRRFRADNPLVKFGAEVYQPRQPINCVYDTWGAPAAMLRGLFEYLYRADALTLLPHIPSGIARLDQHFPIRFGDRRLYLSTRGQGPVTAVTVNGAPWRQFAADRVVIPADTLPDGARVIICLGGAGPAPAPPAAGNAADPAPAPTDPSWTVRGFLPVDHGNLLPLRLGADSNGRTGFAGHIRQARVFASELTAEEIATLAGDAAATLGPGRKPMVDYRLDGEGTGQVPNRAGGDFAAKVVGDVAFETVAGERAARFAGKGFLETAFDPRLNLDGPYSLDAWICPGELPPAGGRIIDKVTAGVDDGYLLDTFPGNSLRLITENGVVMFAADLRPGEWVHVAATANPAGELRLYLNGTRVAVAGAKPRPSPRWAQIGDFYNRLCRAGLAATYEAAHARLIVDYVAAIQARRNLRDRGELTPLPPESQRAADKSYVDAANRLCDGLQRCVAGYAALGDPTRARIAALWQESLDTAR